MMFPRNALILLGPIILMNFGCGSGTSVSSKAANEEKAKTETTNVAKPPDLPPDLIFNGNEYAKEYNDDIAKTVNKYDGKRIEVTGFVRSVDHRQLNWQNNSKRIRKN
jgi:hypothetical protein